MADALEQGIHRVTLYKMFADGLLERMGRGLYRLSGTSPLENPDLVAVAKRVPQGVICLVSALAFHDLTLQVPHAIDVATPRNAEPPRLDYPPVRVFRFSAAAFSARIRCMPSTARACGSTAARRRWPTASSIATRSAWIRCSRP